MKKNLFHISTVTPIFLVVLLLIACENDKKQIDAWTKKVTMKEEATNVESYLSQEGKAKAKLTAPLMYRFFADTPYTEFPKTLHVDFYNDSTQKESWLDCKYGKYFDTQNKVYLRDSVVVINVKGDTLKCRDLWWDQNTKLFYSDNYAEYRTKEKLVNGGKGIEATQDFSRVSFKEVTGILKMKENGFPQ
jgi:LPS export ABC transporter protein LptC